MYLKDQIKIEPLSWSWYSWTQLVSPLTAGMNLKNRYFKIMESFIETPDLHIEACSNRALIGGPFINLDKSYVNKVKHLLEETQKKNRDLFTIVDSYFKLSQYLSKKSDGYSLESLYPIIPDMLKGMVELVYNDYNHCSIRLIEHLLYKKFEISHSQSVIISKNLSDNRDFILSTPRFAEENDLELHINFDSPILDRIFSSREKPLDVKEIISSLGLIGKDVHKFEKLFSLHPNSPLSTNETKPEISIKYFGHACVLIQYNGVSFLIDPILSYNINDSRFSYKDLPKSIDYVLISHAHQDHICFETLIQLRWKIKNIIIPKNNNGFLLDPSLKLILKKIGFQNIIEISEFDSISFSGGEVVSLPFFGEHGDFNIHTKTAYLIRIEKKKFLFAVDSNNLEVMLYKHIRDLYGSVDILFIGMECVGAPQSWLYGPLLYKSISHEEDNSRRLSGSDSNKALQIVQALSPQEVYVYAMGQEPWLSHIMGIGYEDTSPQILESDKLIQKCNILNIKAERLFLKREWNMKV